MTRKHTFKTVITWNDGEDGAEVNVTYRFIKGSPQTWTDPEYSDDIEIDAIKPVCADVVLPDEWTNGDRGEELHLECFADYRDYLEGAAEYRAELARDDWWAA